MLIRGLLIGRNFAQLSQLSGKITRQRPAMKRKYTDKVRTFTYIFLVDSAFVIFNNSPPRMVIEEMAIDLPSSDSAFQALTSEACFTTLDLSRHYGGRPSSNLLLREAVQNLTQPSFTFETSCLYAQMNILSLFAILSGK